MSDQFLNQNKELIEVAKQWAGMVQKKMKGNAVILKGGKESFAERFGEREEKLSDSIKFKINTNNGIISNISFTHEKHGIYVIKGVGRGYHIDKGMVIRTSKDATAINRHPNDWFNPVIDDYLPELADKMAEISADAVLSSTRLLITQDYSGWGLT